MSSQHTEYNNFLHSLYSTSEGRGGNCECDVIVTFYVMVNVVGFCVNLSLIDLKLKLISDMESELCLTMKLHALLIDFVL